MRHSTALPMTLLCIAAALPAMEAQTQGPRALGMGGVGVASANDYDAAYYNPALFGFFRKGDPQKPAPQDNQNLADKSWGAGFDVTVGYRAGGDILEIANDVLKINVNDIKNLKTDEGVRAVSKTAQALGSIVDKLDTTAVTGMTNAGVGIRIGSFGIGGRMSSEVIGKISDIDLQNIGIPLNVGSNLYTTINNAGTAVPSGYKNTVLSDAQVNSLANIVLNNAPAGTTLDQAKQEVYKLDKAAADQGVTASQANDMMKVLTPALQNATTDRSIGSRSIDNNQTTLRLYGFALGEIPVTYGYAINDTWAVGVTGRFLVGRVYGLDVQAYNADNKEFSDYTGDLKNGYKQTLNGTADVAVAARWPWFQAGLTGRNLTSPSFKGPQQNLVINGKTKQVQFDDVQLDPQAVAGVAFIPWEVLTLAVDADLNPVDSIQPGYSTQWVRGGMEWNAFHFLALRGGYSTNIAETDAADLIHAGAGMDFYIFRIDLAGAYATESIELDGEKVPKEGRGSFGLSTVW
jgi:hypothetical protein